MSKKEILYEGYPVVFDNSNAYLDQKRMFLINCIQLYANLSNRELKIIFFNGEDGETGVTFFFKK